MQNSELAELCRKYRLSAAILELLQSPSAAAQPVRGLIEKIPALEEKYRAAGIPQDILTDTLSDLNIWIGEEGVIDGEWLKGHLNFRLFRLGRLQYVLRRCEKPPVPEIREGDWVLDVHVPEGSPLTEENCRASMRQARAFYPRYFQAEPKAMLCSSWLLSPALRDILSEKSGIVQFQSLFRLYGPVGGEAQTYERVFGCGEGEPVDRLKCETTLQRNMIAAIRDGVRFPMYGGCILL